MVPEAAGPGARRSPASACRGGREAPLDAGGGRSRGRASSSPDGEPGGRAGSRDGAGARGGGSQRSPAGHGGGWQKAGAHSGGSRRSPTRRPRLRMTATSPSFLLELLSRDLLRRGGLIRQPELPARFELPVHRWGLELPLLSSSAEQGPGRGSASCLPRRRGR
jgi:hypothetical protein